MFADIASLHHAEKAIEAGAGGHTGGANPFAFVRAVRAIFDGPIVLAGGMTDGMSLAAARMLGCELACMGTRFNATLERRASDTYRQMLLDSTIEEIVLTNAFWGLNANVLRSSIVAAGLDTSKLVESVSEARARQSAGSLTSSEGPPHLGNIWSAGHAVSGVRLGDGCRRPYQGNHWRVRSGVGERSFSSHMASTMIRV